MSEFQNRAAAKLSDALGAIPEQYQEQVTDLLLNNIGVAAAVLSATKTAG